jgi:putative peptidoglycan binding protein
VPRALAIDDDRKRPSARRGKRKQERGLLMRLFLWLFLRNPRDAIAGSAAAIAVLAIIVNALFLQAGRHPSPMFGSTIVLPQTPAPPKVAAVPTEAANPLPRPRPSEADAPLIEQPKSDDPVGNLVRATSMPAAASSRVAAVQRALSEYGYGQIRPTGTIGADTQAAIQRFERERKMPITGQMSDRLVRELGLATGKPIQ